MNIKYSVIFLFLIISFSAKSQKLPTIQTISLLAPKEIKIDGKSTEWGNKFQAYNNAVNAFYTIANDNDYLYLVIQVKDIYVINKIFSSGITFIINKSGEKNEDKVVSITYPAIDRTGKPNIDLIHKPNNTANGADLPDKPDSVVIANNVHITKFVKWIRVTGVEGIDTLISVYNRDGIKAAGLFDNKMAYNYELAISLKNLGLTENLSAKIAYRLKFNGASMNNMNGYTTGPLSKTGFPTSVHIEPGALLLTADVARFMASTTDFWGEYTLAKK
jgi:hypothetical protein